MMLEQVKKRIAAISSEVDELHPLLETLFNKHPKILRTEYTHGKDELGADFVLTRNDDILHSIEYVGIVAKRGKIHLNLDDVQRQIDECTTIPRKVDGAKKEVTLSQVWVISTGNITNGAKEKIHAKYPGTNVQFIDLEQLARLVDEYVPSFVAEVDLPVSTYLSDTKVRMDELDKNLDLLHLDGEPLYIEQDVVHVEIDPYRVEQRSAKRKYKRVDLWNELPNNRIILVEAGMGGGKSKLLRKLAYYFADVDTFTEEKVLPIHTTFKELVDKFDSDLRTCLEETISEETRGALRSDVKYLFLVDAVDEKATSPEELSSVLESIIDAVDKEPSYNVIFASRHISNVDFDKLFLHRISRYEIAPLSMGKIITFLNTICRKLNLHSRIIEDLQRSHLFDRLPRNPLAAMLLGQLLAENQQELPLTMTELYEKYMELVLGRWDMSKGLQSQQEFETLEILLMDFAHYLMENELVAVNIEELGDRFRTYLSDRNLKVDAERLIDLAITKAEVLTRSQDGYSVCFKHRSFAEFLCAKWWLKHGALKPDARAFGLYWSNTYFFGLGLEKDAPELLEALIDIPTAKDSQRWMKVFGLADFLMAAYATPYRIIVKGVHHGVLEAALLYQDTADGKVALPLSERLSRMHLLQLIQIVIRDNYGYEFLAPAMEEAGEMLMDGDEDTQTRAYAMYLLSLAYIDAGGDEELLDLLLEEFKALLPVDLRLALWHEGADLETKNKVLRKLRRHISAALRKDKRFFQEAKRLHEVPVAVLERQIERSSSDESRAE